MKLFQTDIIEELLSFERETLSKKVEEPILLTSEIKETVLILGYSQNLTGLNLNEVKKEKLKVYRRCSGGSAVLSKKVFITSLFLPNNEQFYFSIANGYNLFVKVFKNGLNQLVDGVEESLLKEKVDSPICFLSQSGETLLYKGKKFFGGAQVRNKNCILIHFSLLQDLDYFLHQKIFGIDAKILKEKIVSLNVDTEKLREKIYKSFSQELNSSISFPPEKPQIKDEFMKETQTSKLKPI